MGHRLPRRPRPGGGAARELCDVVPPVKSEVPPPCATFAPPRGPAHVVEHRNTRPEPRNHRDMASYNLRLTTLDGSSHAEGRISLQPRNHKNGPVPPDKNSDICGRKPLKGPSQISDAATPRARAAAAGSEPHHGGRTTPTNMAPPRQPPRPERTPRPEPPPPKPNQRRRSGTHTPGEGSPSTPNEAEPPAGAAMGARRNHNGPPADPPAAPRSGQTPRRRPTNTARTKRAQKNQNKIGRGKPERAAPSRTNQPTNDPNQTNQPTSTSTWPSSKNGCCGPLNFLSCGVL